MDAIPSLCASTASCGAAAIGYAYGRSSAKRNETERAGDGVPKNSTTPVAPRHSTSNPPTTRIPKSQTPRRPQSAYIARAPHSWDPLKRRSVDQDTEAAVQSGQERVDTGEDITGELGQDIGQGTAKSSWLRRMSIIAQSLDGSTVSTPRPGSPSIFSNTSNVPFVSPQQPDPPRNRLVKRSTSSRVLHSASQSGSPSSLSQTPTFRRPATSHQRSAQFKYHSLQQTFESTSTPVKGLREQEQGPAAAETDPDLTDRPTDWQPYFQTKSVRVTRESSRRTASLPLSASRVDSFRCVHLSFEYTPTLLKGDAVAKLPAYVPQSLPTNPQSSPFAYPRPLDTGAPAADVDAAVTSRLHSPKRKTSFSMSDMMSTPSPPWKMRGGSLRRKKGRDGMTPGRRAVSAPLGQGSDHPDAFGSDCQEQESNIAALGSESVSAHQRAPPPRTNSSPLPPLERFSAFSIDILTKDSSDPPSPVLEQSSSPSLRISPDTNTRHALSTKPTRTSRVPSERDSTVFSSDNEHSRLFSNDGDDTDYRSETVFDSLRTDATGSSHSGARGHRLETVFGDQATPELLKHNLAALQEKLSNASMASPDLQDGTIVEESESVRTPVRPTRPVENGLTTPLQANYQASNILGSSPPVDPSSTRSVHEYPQDIDFEEQWSADDGEDEDDDWHVRKPTKPDRNANNPLDSLQELPSESYLGMSQPSDDNDFNDRPRSSIFDWSERQRLERAIDADSSPRPRTAQVKQLHERGSRSAGRRAPSGFHLRSQSVPLPPENSNHRFNNASKLDAWMLGGKGVSEDWGDDFEFDEPALPNTTEATPGTMGSDRAGKPSSVIVPPSILEKQASVHGQFGQVKELTLLVEELRRLRHAAHVHGIMHGQSSELWKEAEGIIDLATLDEEESDFFAPHSPNSANFEFDAFEEDSLELPPRRRSSTSRQRDVANESSFSSPIPSRPSPASSRFETPSNRPRKESIAKAKHVLENIHQHRSSLGPVPDEQVLPKKLPFDTTSLRDLVTRAGVVTRALKEIIRRLEDPDYVSQTPERRPQTPPDPPFSQIFQQPSSPPSSKKSPRMVRRRSSSSFLNNSQPAANDNDINGHMKFMTVV